MLVALPPSQYHHQHRQQCQRGYFNLPLVPTTGAKSSYSYWHHRPHAGRPAITPLRMLGQQLHYHCCQATTSIVATIASTSLSIRGAIPPFAADAINSNGASTSTACQAILGPSTIATEPLASATGSSPPLPLGPVPRHCHWLPSPLPPGQHLNPCHHRYHKHRLRCQHTPLLWPLVLAPCYHHW